MDSSRLLPAVQKLVKLFNADSAPQRGRIGLFNFILQIFIMIIQSLVNVLIHKPRRRIKRAQGQSGLDAAILDELCAKSPELDLFGGVFFCAAASQRSGFADAEGFQFQPAPDKEGRKEP